ncbi:MAG TPA: HrpE/YscL family type III secretion apparatus protein [Chlamydiales bacterium]|jgi:type III secretion protein L
MTKYFSMLSKNEVHAAPGVKIIPSDEFSTLASAIEIVEIVKKDAESFKRETAIEAEKTKELAFQEGFEQGLTSLNKHLFALDKELKQLREEVQQKILPLALKAARKIVGEELALHPDRIVDVVLTSLKPVTQHKKITIYVNRMDLDALEKNKPKLKHIFEHLESLSLQERDDVETGGCIIETEAGIINAQLETQWRSLELAFESFMKK